MIETTVEPPKPKQRHWVRAILVLICALILAMWVYAFGFASKEGVYFVTDKGWRSSADQICSNAERQRQALQDTTQGYISNPTPAQMVQRADIVDHATDIIEGMLNDVAALPLADEKDRERVRIFVRYYREIIADRRAYTGRLRAFDLQPYRESLVNGSPVTNTVIDFTTGNAITHCMPPGELGGDV